MIRILEKADRQVCHMDADLGIESSRVLSGRSFQGKTARGDRGLTEFGEMFPIPRDGARQTVG